MKYNKDAILSFTSICQSALRTSVLVFLTRLQHDLGSSSKCSNYLPLPWASGRGVWLSCPWCRPGWSTRHEDAAKMPVGWGNRGNGLGWESREGESSGSFGSTSSTCRRPGGARSRTASEGGERVWQVRDYCYVFNLFFVGVVIVYIGHRVLRLAHEYILGKECFHMCLTFARSKIVKTTRLNFMQLGIK